MADLAHELRTPVNGLLGRIEAAQDGVLADKAANLAAMHDEAVRLTRLLDDLSSLAEAERPGLLLSAEPVDLAALAERQATSFAGALRDKGIAFSSDLETTIVSGDPKRLEQIVANLLSNALRYTDAGGRVTLRVGPQGGRGRPRGRRHRHRHPRRRPASRLHALLARREVALAGHGRRRDRPRDRPRAGACPRGARHRGERGRRGLGLPRRPARQRVAASSRQPHQASGDCVNAVTLFGVVAVSFMMLMYALESRGRGFILAFALGCLLSSAYGFLSGAWPFGVVEAIWSLVALRRIFTTPGVRPHG